MSNLYIVLFIILFICGALIFYVMFAHSFLFLYLYVDRSLNTLRNPQKYPPITALQYMHNYWVELWYILSKFYLYPLRFFNLSVHNHQSDCAVLLIHGYCRTQTDWLWLRRQIKNLPIFLVNLKPSLAPIEEITSRSIPAKIAQIQKLTGCKKIVLIGHSMGGLVASYYSEYLDQQHLITDIITIGSPLHGTRVSIVGAGENARQMCPGSKFLIELRHKIHHSNKTYYQIGTHFENLLYPWDSCLLPDTPEEHKFVVKMTPHLSMLHSKEVATQINKWLEVTK